MGCQTAEDAIEGGGSREAEGLDLIDRLLYAMCDWVDDHPVVDDIVDIVLVVWLFIVPTIVTVIVIIWSLSRS